MPPLTTKTELALKSYLLATVDQLSGVHLRAAREDLAGAGLGKPSLLITTVGIDLADDLPPSSGTYAVDLLLRLTWPVLDPAPALDHTLLELLACLHRALANRPGAQAVLNRPTTGADTRAVPGFHLLDLLFLSTEPTSAGSDHLQDIRVRALVVNTDA